MANFGSRLSALMTELNLNQAQVSALTGIGRSSISQYLSGKNEPPKEKRRRIAQALGVQDDYFEEILPEPAKIQRDGVFNLPVDRAAQLMKKSKEWVMKGLQDGVFPWGYAVKLSKWSYFISSKKFTEYTGIEIPEAKGE